MNKIIFKINSIKQEKEIVKFTKANLGFLKKEKIIFTLPQESVEKQYNKMDLEEAKRQIEVLWEKRENGFFNKLETLFNIKTKKPFQVFVSNYGVLGSYDDSKKSVFINKNSRLNIISTIKHEIIHIILEPYIQKFKIDYGRKEQMVNFFLNMIEDK